MDNYNDYEQEINLKDCFFYVLRHLKLMLIVALVLGLLLGAYKGYTEYSKELKYSETNNIENISNYAKSIESLSKELDSKKASLVNYINNSAFLSLDPYSSYQIVNNYFVSTDYKIIASNSYQDIDYTWSVINSYVSYLSSDDILQQLATKNNLELSNLKEFVDISCDNSIDDKENYIISISVYSNDKDEALSILDSFDDILPSITNKINKSVVNNSISLVSTNIYKGENSDILNKQQEFTSNFKSLLSDINSTQSSIDSLSELSYIGNPIKALTSSFIKWFLIGFVVGGVLIAGVYFLIFIFNNKVYSADEFKDKTNIRVLGNIASDKLSFIDKLEHRPINTDINLLSSNLNTFSNSKTILFTGELLDEQLLSKLNNKDIISTGSIIEDSKAIDSLSKTNDIVLVVKCNKTDYKTINEVRQRIKDLNKNIVGCVVVE